MLPQHVLLALVAAVSAVPLNINLGAYSPALVVGDGEISLGSKESASELMATLATGAQAKGEGAAAKQGQPEQPAEKPAAVEVVAEPAAEKPKEGESKAEEKAAKRSNVVRAINDILNKRSAPTEDQKMVAVEKAMDWIKRDLQSFEAALKYAGEAMKNQPKVEMGSEGVGVGLVVSPGVNVPKDSAANGKEAKVKRDEPVDEEVDEESESPKMTLVAITEV